jgi:hypothetical protein
MSSVSISLWISIANQDLQFNCGRDWGSLQFMLSTISNDDSKVSARAKNSIEARVGIISLIHHFYSSSVYF